MKAKLFILSTLILMITSCGGSKDVYTIETTYGNIKIKLYDDTPLHKASFEKLVAEKAYDGTCFHRVINEFMIQGGDITRKDSTYQEELIPAEFVSRHYHKKGALAAARMGDRMNPEKKSSTQFYIVQGKQVPEKELRDMEEFYGKAWSPQQKETYASLGGTPHLDGEYTVFGEVISGLDVVDVIASVYTDRFDEPMSEVQIIRIVKD